MCLLVYLKIQERCLLLSVPSSDEVFTGNSLSLRCSRGVWTPQFHVWYMAVWWPQLNILEKCLMTSSQIFDPANLQSIYCTSTAVFGKKMVSYSRLRAPPAAEVSADFLTTGLARIPTFAKLLPLLLNESCSWRLEPQVHQEVLPSPSLLPPLLTNI